MFSTVPTHIRVQSLRFFFSKIQSGAPSKQGFPGQNTDIINLYQKNVNFDAVYCWGHHLQAGVGRMRERSVVFVD